MIALNSPQPPAVPSGLEALTLLLALVTQPEDARAYLAQITKARVELEHQRAETEETVRKLKEEHDALKQQMRLEAAAHRQHIALERDKCDQHCQAAMDEVRGIQAETAKLNTEAWGTRQAANALKVRYEQKMQLMEQVQSI